MEVSHLCHNPACFNPDHIVIEPKLDNASRIGCKNTCLMFKGDHGTILTTCDHRVTTAIRKACIPRVVKFVEGGVYTSLSAALSSVNQ